MTDSAFHVFTVRGRPVEFRPSQFGGGLFAVERGAFPASPTGYRSLAGHFPQFGPGNPEDLSVDFLESLAEAYDKDRGALRTRLHRIARGGDFISISMAAVEALDHGFFAPPEEHIALWQEAYRLFCLIDTLPRFQPQPYSAAWTPEYCAKALAEQRALLRFVRQLATGSFPPAPHKLFGAKAYLSLPPKPEGEPGFILPGIASEFAFDLSTPTDSDDGETDDAEATGAAGEDAGAPRDRGGHAQPPQATLAVQLNLFQ
ncbi:hypothetical protein OH491_24860 [Termitidicoccus mucosus]|uniref:Uncharacterized protein n=1 Tax=Termitidicoccus mucosus TaxID=1184151 RepID=A0A178IR76_9BACT|nr:hypothetical protein AW736_01670 [Opitutaceae bacterium TSB47]